MSASDSRGEDAERVANGVAGQRDFGGKLLVGRQPIGLLRHFGRDAAFAIPVSTTSAA